MTKEEEKKVMEELGEWIGERMGEMKDYVLFGTIEGKGKVLHSQSMSISKLLHTTAWMLTVVAEGIGDAERRAEKK